MAELIGIRQTCKALGVSERTVRRLVDDGRLKSHKQDGRVFFDAEQVKWLRAERRRNAEKPGHKGAVNLSLEDYGRIMSELGELRARSNLLLEDRTAKDNQIKDKEDEIRELRAELERLRSRNLWDRLINK